MCWSQRLKRVFQIDVTICSVCGGALRIIASIEDPFVICTILDHLAGKSSSQATMDENPEIPKPERPRLAVR